MLELRDKLTGVEQGTTAPAAELPAEWTSMEKDVLSALVNLGCARPAAEEAIRKAKQPGAPEGFEPFFRSALALVR